MKMIGHLQAVAASRQIPEEYMPSKLPYPADLADAIRERYGFQNFPDTAKGGPFQADMHFSAGKFGNGKDAFGIGFLIMEPVGDVVQAMTTDQADRILDDLAAFLSEAFEYRMPEKDLRRSYTSNLVVEFDDVVENYIGKLGAISEAFNRVRLSPAGVSLRRIAFGGPATPILDQVSNVENAEFLIESRVSVPNEPRRYYCSAPIRTEDHVRLMEQIEDILKG